jgi:hypothetical protein
MFDPFATLSATQGLVLDVLRLGQAHAFSSEQAATYGRAPRGKPRHNEDALLLVTAKGERATLVCGRQEASCRRKGVEAIAVDTPSCEPS